MEAAVCEPMLMHDNHGNQTHNPAEIAQSAVCWASSVGSVLGELACVMQRSGFHPPLSFRLR